MKKAFSISLAGILFSLEEDAYKKLEAYLHKLSGSFASDQDKDEILNDIELSIADKFSRFRKAGQHVMTLKEINSVIADVGTADQIKESQGTPNTFSSRRIFHFLNSGFKKLSSFTLSTIGLFSMFIISFLIIGITAAVGVLLFVPDSPYIAKPFPNFPASPNEIMVIVLGFCSIALPLVYILLLAVSLMKRRYILSSLTTMTLGLVWVISLIATIIFAVSVSPDIAKRLETIASVQKSYPVDDFSHIRMDGKYTLHLSEGKEYKVQISGDPRRIEQTKVSSSNNTLSISSVDSSVFCIFCSIRNPEVIISAPNIEELIFYGSLYTNAEGFTDKQDLRLELHGGSFIDLEGVNLKNLTLEMDGASQITASGYANNLFVTTNGAVQLEGSDLETENTEVNSSGASQIELWVHDILTGRITGASNLEYRGDPQVNLQTTGASNVDKLD